ncbi:MAG: Rpn family recombination-promoting nuclease/putative transposase [Klebsiella huaxiensis]|uniref:Rpn family recombination-promoting nuclease/putative transposase n=1 Tax=Klebsiella huaxiensis TaxID=2153354 RepID=UPI0026EC191F|nr:Rpn family recombination-promoting nuclease/putative transposase [Klebsiella huaxiensis]WEJ89708.1 MAG: Rpn family recombination-promoting nuclease/putative transposase [Klebsiella huaxiensis]
MERFSHTPHDAIFRQMLTQKEVARDFLQLYLPAQFLRICDLDTLQLTCGSFIEEDLRASYSDILYSLQTQHGAGYIYALIEHQSSPDKLMAFRLIRYALAAMQRHLDAGHDTLPLVVPILFYHGSASPWPHTLNWHHLFDNPKLASALYSGDFPLVDLTVMPDNQIVRHQRMAMLELLQKHIRQRDLAELQPMLITLLAQGYLTETQINTLISYMLQAGTTEKPGPLIRELAKQSPRHKELLMTIAEWLEEKGRKKGRQEGLLEGRQELSRSIALKMLASGLDAAMIMEMTGLSQEELSSLAP